MLNKHLYILVFWSFLSFNIYAQDTEKKKDSKLDKLIRETEELLKKSEESRREETEKDLSGRTIQPVKSTKAEKEGPFFWGWDPYSKEVAERMKPRIKKLKGWIPLNRSFSLNSPDVKPYFSPVLLKMQNYNGLNEPEILERTEHLQYKSIFQDLVKKINDSIHKDDFKAFLKLCEPADSKEKLESFREMYEKLSEGMLFFPAEPVGFLYNKKFPNLIVVELYTFAKWGTYVNLKGFKDHPIDQKTMTFKEYSEKSGKHMVFYRDTLRFGFRYTLYFQYNETKKKWLLTLKNHDLELEKLLKDGPFYAHIRRKIWSGSNSKGKQLTFEEIDDINNPFNYKEHYVRNNHFSLEEAIGIEKFVHEINELYLKSDALSPQEHWMYNQLAEFAYADYDEFSQNKNFDHYFTEETGREVVEKFNKINYQDREMTYLSGKERLRRYIGKYNVKIFKKPILFDCKPKKVVKESRNSPLELLAAFISRNFNELDFDGNPLKYKRKEYQKAGLDMFQLQGYQIISFAGVDVYRFFGFYLNSNDMYSKKMYIPYTFTAMLSPKTKQWVYCSVIHLPHEAPLMLLPMSMFRAAMNYEYLLNAVFDEMPDSDGFFNSKPTGKNFNDRLKKLGIHEIMKIREPEECIPYKKGLDYKKLPTYSLNDVEKSE